MNVFQRIAEILVPEGIDGKGRKSRIKTAYGEKTREGVADLIKCELETGTPLIAAAPDLLNMLQRMIDEGTVGKPCLLTLEHARKAVANATGKGGAS